MTSDRRGETDDTAGACDRGTRATRTHCDRTRRAGAARLLARAVVAITLAAVAACGSSGDTGGNGGADGGTGGAGAMGGAGGSAGGGQCASGDTRQCVGPGACAGGQQCVAGTWSSCDCGSGGAAGTSGAGASAGAGGTGAEGGTGATSGAGGSELDSGADADAAPQWMDDPCPIDPPLDADCSGQCGDPKKCKDFYECGIFQRGLPEYWRTPAAPLPDCGCSTVWKYHTTVSGPGRMIARVGPPWRLAPAPDLFSDACLTDPASTVSNCIVVELGEAAGVRVLTDDPNAPARNISLVWDQFGSCP